MPGACREPEPAAQQPLPGGWWRDWLRRGRRVDSLSRKSDRSETRGGTPNILSRSRARVAESKEPHLREIHEAAKKAASQDIKRSTSSPASSNKNRHVVTGRR